MNTLAVLLLGLAARTTVAAQTTRPHPNPIRLTSTRDLVKYVGTYPCTNGLLRDKVLLSSLKNILDRDYSAYREHMALSGCGAIEKRDGLLLMDVSQLHVGGYTSFILVRVEDGAVFLFWLRSTVTDRQWSFYGQRPIPTAISQVVQSELNTTWGHVAHFSVHGDQVDIRLNDSK